MRTIAVEAAESVIDLIYSNEDTANHADGCCEQLIDRAEREMGLRFPPSYRRLIEEFGTWEAAPTEFPGLYQTPAGGDGLLGTVAYTLEDREALRLPHHLMVVMHDDVWGVVVLDTSRPDRDGEYPVYAWNPGVLDGGLMEKIADNFGIFALDECRQAIGHWPSPGRSRS
ncbi:SMI1/KNR4 family protein [Streptomyces seoulensis]